MSRDVPAGVISEYVADPSSPPPPPPTRPLRDDRIPGTDQAVREGRHGAEVAFWIPTQGRWMPAVVRMPACHSRRFKGDREGVCPACALRATYIMTILDLAPKLTTVCTTAFSRSP